jgi:hypothetical protein
MLAFVFIDSQIYNTRVMKDSTGKNNTGVIFFPKWPIYSFVTHRNENIIREWLRQEKIPRTQVAIFQAKIDAYERGGARSESWPDRRAGGERHLQNEN